MSSTEIKAAAEEIALVWWTAADRGVPAAPTRKEMTAKVEAIITRHLTPAGAEEAVAQAAEKIAAFLEGPNYEGATGEYPATEADIEFFEGFVLSAIQSVRPEIAETQAVMEELVRALKAGEHGTEEMCPWCLAIVGADEPHDQYCAFSLALAHAEEVLKPPRTIAEERKE